MSAKFTPGPWHADAWEGFSTRDGNFPIIHDEECFIIAKPGEDAEAWVANAHLIAAAPELYGALSRVFEAFADYDFDARENGEELAALAEVRAALAKARGES